MTLGVTLDVDAFFIQLDQIIPARRTLAFVAGDKVGVAEEGPGISVFV